MAAREAHLAEEAAPLFPQEASALNAPKADDEVVETTRKLVLPVALLAALAMSSTAATSYFAYATLLCKDPAHCEGNEKSRYAGTVAITAAVANIMGMMALGHLQKISMRNSKLSLLLWMITRSMSAVMLLLGVSIGNITVALSGRAFEGVASDNLLHYVLNSIYSRSKDQRKISALIGYSLALYLTGISISPFVAGLFRNFIVSFFIALGIFATAIIYLQCFIPGQSAQSTELHRPNSPKESRFRKFSKTIRVIFVPLRTFREHPSTIFVGLSLLAYNVVQSYMFNALLVHTSLQFGFTGRENGFLISIAHVVAALYIFLNLCVIPKVTAKFQRKDPASDLDLNSSSIALRDSILALVSLLIEVLSLVGVGLATTSGQLYALTAMLALSLPASSFIKAAFVAHLEGEDKSKGLASLAAMETLGSVLGPVVLGGWQSYSVAGRIVFFIAAVIAFSSAVLFGAGIIMMQPVGRTSEHLDSSGAGMT